MKKYNITINVLFWVLAALISFIAVMSMVTPEQIADSLFPGRREKVIIRTKIQKEPTVLTVEKDVEWFYFEATGYSANDPAQGTNGITATGLDAEEGIVAVDPEIIPLGTEIEIKGLGRFAAEDTGGKIKGNRIDIFFDSKQEAKDFGRKGVWVKVEDRGVQLAQSFN
ncbi:MAG: 3D domain-containing protein [Actinomycetota bacterium]